MSYPETLLSSLCLPHSPQQAPQGYKKPEQILRLPRKYTIKIVESAAIMRLEMKDKSRTDPHQLDSLLAPLVPGLDPLLLLLLAHLQHDDLQVFPKLLPINKRMKVFFSFEKNNMFCCDISHLAISLILAVRITPAIAQSPPSLPFSLAMFNLCG